MRGQADVCDCGLLAKAEGGIAVANATRMNLRLWYLPQLGLCLLTACVVMTLLPGIDAVRYPSGFHPFGVLMFITALKCVASLPVLLTAVFMCASRVPWLRSPTAVLGVGALITLVDTSAVLWGAFVASFSLRL